MYETIRVTTHQAYKIIYLNRPEVFNAMNMKMIEELYQEFSHIAASTMYRAVIVTGAGEKAFSAGADIDEMQFDDATTVLQKTKKWVALFKLIETMPQPVIAAVKGYAPAGGTELTLACDYVITNETAKFGLAEITIGVMPGAGAIARLTKWLGRARVKEILLFGKMIDAKKAYEWGLSNELLTAQDPLERAQEVAEELSARSLPALANIKAAINLVEEIPYQQAIDVIMRDFSFMFGTPDQREGMAAFVEKRKPNFEQSRGDDVNANNR